MFSALPSPARDYGRLLRRSWWLLALGLLIGGGAAYAVSVVQTPVYTGTASIAFENVSQQAALIGGATTQTLETPAQLAAKSSKVVDEDNVLRQALSRTGSKLELSTLRDDVTATVDPATNLVKVEVEAPAPDAAARLAGAIAAIAAEATNNRAREQLRADAQALAERIKAIPNRPANAFTRQGEQANLSRIQSLSILARPASVVQRASLPDAPSSPKTGFNVLLGGVLGLLVGFSIAFGREATDRRVRSTDEIAEQLGVPVLAEVEDTTMGSAPYLLSERDEAADLAVATFGILRRNIELANLGNPTRVVAVVSAAPEEGKTTVALALSCAFASVGRRAVLVEADLRRPVLAERLGVEPGPGLGDYLTGSHELDAITRRVQMTEWRGASTNGQSPPSLACLLAGTAQRDPDELLASNRFRELLQTLGTSYETIVLDTCPLLPVADTLEILPFVDSYVVCVRSGRTLRDNLTALGEILSRLPTQPVGVIATGVPRRDLRTGDYGAYYASSKGVTAG